MNHCSLQSTARLAALAVLSLVAACGSSEAPGIAVTPAPAALLPPVEPAVQRSTFLTAVPPGSNGNSAGGVGAPAGVPTDQFRYPANFRDQLDLYGNLAYARSPLKLGNCTPPANIAAHAQRSDLACNYFKAAPLTITDAESIRTTNLTAPNGKAVVLRRDGWGVPYVEGDDRPAAQFGLGYAAAQDRLWLWDILRNVGRGQVTRFLGPAPSLYDTDAQFGVPAGYSEEELTGIVNNAVAKLGPLGQTFLNDTEMFVAGMNAYIESLQGENAGEVPTEYLTLAAGPNPTPAFPPRPFTVNDIVANAVLIQSALGRGGGAEATSLKLLQTLDASITGTTTTLPAAACNLWRDLRHADIPDTPHTIDRAFPTQSPPVIDERCPLPLPAGTAIWDAGSYRDRVISTATPLLPLTARQGSQRAKTAIARAAAPKRPAAATVKLASADGDALRRLLNDIAGLPMTSSNWIAINGSLTASGHPILVGGPQTGYNVPQLLWEAAVVSKGGTPLELAARGISTVNLPYVVIGRGLDFAWTPTSATGDIQDTRVSTLCNTNGSPASRDDGNGDGFPDADGYLYRGQCVRLYRRVDRWTAFPTAASLASGGGPSPENVARFVLRTHYGPVVATATVRGAPVAISIQRSTFLSDVDTAAPFALLTTTGRAMSHPRFKQLFNSMTSVFHWAYVDSRDAGYFQSGLYPQRAPTIHPDLPQWGDGNHEWAADAALPADFFTRFGGDATAGGLPYPARTVPTAIGEPLDGFYEWRGFLPLAAHIQETNPARGYMANWNNAGAPGWWAADNNSTNAGTHRVQQLSLRLDALKARGRKITLAEAIEVTADGAYTDLRGYDVLPQLIRLMQQGALSADQQAVVTLMQRWLDDGSAQWISGGKGLGAYRRDRDADGVYEHRAAVVLMDAWYRRMMDRLLPQMAAIESAGASALVGRFDAPRAQGSAFQEGWFQHIRRVVDTALQTPGRQDYRVLQCAGSGTPANCRAELLTALDEALADLGGLANQASWDGSTLPNAKNRAGAVVEDYDSVEHTSFSFLPVPPIHWINRPTFHQAAEILTDRNGQ